MVRNCSTIAGYMNWCGSERERGRFGETQVASRKKETVQGRGLKSERLGKGTTWKEGKENSE